MPFMSPVHRDIHLTGDVDKVGQFWLYRICTIDGGIGQCFDFHLARWPGSKRAQLPVRDAGMIDHPKKRRTYTLLRNWIRQAVAQAGETPGCDPLEYGVRMDLNAVFKRSCAHPSQLVQTVRANLQGPTRSCPSPVVPIWLRCFLRGREDQ
jgi:hypothetical protein